MKKITIALFIVLISLSARVSAQIPVATLVQISRAEDELRYDKTLENLMKNASARVRTRAALAAGRIGNDAAIPALINLLEKDKDANVQAMAAFAIGEIESIKGADAILKVLQDANRADAIRARAVESAGKIALANKTDEKSKTLGEAILDTLEAEDRRGKQQSRDVVLLGLTAALRVRPEETDFIAARFLTNLDARVRADAANTLARLQAKNANEALRAMVLSETDAVARANAVRALSAAQDKEAFNLLLEAAVEDEDLRVRVSAIRALGNLRDARAAEKLLQRGENLLTNFKANKNELLEIATTLGRILPKTDDEKALKFLKNLRETDKFSSSETEIAYARVAPKIYVESIINANEEAPVIEGWRASSAIIQGLGETANLEANKENDLVKSQVRLMFVRLIGEWVNLGAQEKATSNERFAIPDLVRAFAAFKSENTSNIFRPMLEIERDIFIRAAIAEVLAEQAATKENVEALKKAFDSALLTDKDYNDAQLAILDALAKLDKNESVSKFVMAFSSNDYLVRKKAFDLLKDNNSPLVNGLREKLTAEKLNQVLPYSSGSKLGQILNTNADYTRAVSRKNGQTKAVLTTERGVFTIEFFPEDAPLTVDNFIKLAKSGYFNGLAVHRVVPNFVMQDGDPRGDGNGGPGWEIRCEINMLSYERGAVGMALSGKDTGGSQWFVTHSPQPHLDGGYTVFGRVNESDMKIVDSIARGDKILSVKIIEGKLPRKKSGKK